MTRNATAPALRIQHPEEASTAIRPFGYSQMECGYCKGSRASLLPNRSAKDCSKSYGMLADSMTPEVYEGLLYRGWRRSGVHLYKPSNFESCCPTMTIRLEAAKFKPTKSQAKVGRKLENLLSPKSTRPETQKKSAKRPRPNSKSANVMAKYEVMLQQSALLPVLAEETRKALNKSNIQSSSVNLDTVPVNFKLRPVSKSDDAKSQCTIASSVCAQLAGKLQLPSRASFLEEVVAKLRTSPILANYQTETPNDTLASRQPIIRSIEGHEKSGQISILLEWTAWSANKVPLQSSEVEDVSMRELDDDDDDVFETSPPTATSSSVPDKLGDWYLRTIGKPLWQDQRVLKVETLPAHESALNPEIHRLYAHYQHIVHQDDDPFQAIAETSSKHTSDNNSSGVIVMEEEAERPQDEPESENASNGGHVNGSNKTDGSPTKDDDQGEDPQRLIQNLDWGNHAPSNFKNQVLPMLQSYIAPYPTHVQLALIHNYYSFYQFLVESPLDAHRSSEQERINGSKADVPCGTYHQHYKIGDALIAVGVVDILPSGLSSVYLYYHPGFSHSLVALGKVAILKEIDYTNQSLSKPYYYLGFYIESCQKMRYKGDYHPSQLLCPVTYEWIDCTIAVPKIRATPLHVCQLAEPKENSTDDVDEAVEQRSLNAVNMDIGAGMVVTYEMLQPGGQEVVKPILQEFLLEAGPTLGPQCLVKLT